MHKMALLISHGCHTSDDQYMNAAPMIFQKRHDQREKIRWWWEYSKPKKKQRGLLHQLGHSMIIINLAMASIKEHDHHHFNIGVVAQDPAVICLAALLFTLCSHFTQAMVGGYEKQMVEKEAANFMLSWGDRYGTRNEQHQPHRHQHVTDGSFSNGLVRN